MDKTIKEIIDASVGLNEDGTSKIGVCVSLEMMNAISKKMEHITHQTIWESEVDIKRHDAFLQIDFIYNASNDENLKLLWDFIDDAYSNSLNNTADDINRTPMCLITLMPYSLEGEYYIQGINPIFWSLQPKKPGSEYTILRLKFEERDVQFLKGEFDYESLEGQIQEQNENIYEKYSNGANNYSDETDYDNEEDDEIDF